LGFQADMQIFDRLKHWLPLAARKAPVVFTAPLAPEEPLWVVGDIHGRADLLLQLLQEIGQPDWPAGAAAPRLVFVGDYIDRGEQSREVLDIVAALAAANPARMTALMGNHEKMLLDFIDRPQERGLRWLRNGGLQTLASFGIGGLSEASSPDKLVTASNRLNAAIGADGLAWLRARPLQMCSGNIHVVHAGADPALPLDAQNPRTLVWGCEAFLKTPRRDDNWVVYGHTITETPAAQDGRIAVDSGAVFSGRLTAAHIRAGAVAFHCT
jgi:diadenosine tetraphosphatase ApaH/serine/threonine PP2A family protein phosphatase